MLGATIGLVEAIGFLRAPHGPTGPVERTLRAIDPLLYLALLLTAFVPAGTFTLTPLQLGGICTGLLFLIGLIYVWLAFVERAPTPTPAS